MKSIYYAVYDISQDGIRETVINILKDAGLSRVQKSVFCGMISNQEKKDLAERIKRIIDAETDSFYLIMNCNRCFEKVILIGNDFDLQYVTNSKPSMVF